MEFKIQEYSDTAAGLAQLRGRMEGVVYDVATTGGMDSARKDRRELVTLRTTLESKRKEIKAPALERCKLIDEEAKRITAEILKPRFELMALSAKGGFLQVIKDETVWAREIMFALQILRGSDLLQKADQDSIKNAVVNIALCGTTLNPAMNMAYLVPRDGRCCLDISYRGLAQIAMDSGGVKHIAPRLVYSFDTFEYQEIDGEPHVKHSPNFNPPPEFTAGPEKFWDFLVCGYVIASLPDGTKIVTQPLPKWKLEKAMKTSKTSSGKTPWRTHPDEMSLKTLVKHAYKLLPQTDRMSSAVTILNEHEGIDKGDAPRRSSIEERFGFGREDGGEAPAADGPDLCPSCQKVRILGKCHNQQCPEGEPPPEG